MGKSTAITRFTKLSPSGQKPQCATEVSAGVDLVSVEEVDLLPGQRKLVGTGIAVEFHEGFALLVCPRSGLALNHGVTVLNTPGVVDSDYRGEIKVLLVNLGDSPYKVKPGDRMAQGVLVQIAKGTWKEVDVLDDTARGSGGFGSSGT
jgi:dUTP pyrophosphatase